MPNGGQLSRSPAFQRLRTVSAERTPGRRATLGKQRLDMTSDAVNGAPRHSSSSTSFAEVYSRMRRHPGAILEEALTDLTDAVSELL
jgi:hypothetical protein